MQHLLHKPLLIGLGIALITGVVGLPGPVHAVVGTGLMQHARQSIARQKIRVRRLSAPFRVPKGLEAPVAFWRDIYSAYDRNHVVLHDMDALEIIYDVVDLSDISPDIDPFAPYPPDVQKARLARVEEAMERVRRSLKRLAENPGRRDITPFERKTVRLFQQIPGGPEKYAAASGPRRLRSQTGLSNRFRAGIVASGKYLAQIEAVFAEGAMPWEVTRLVFVESMFDLRAYSKVGASGIWQFMPGTARMMGLTMNQTIDERNDPLAATRAAARLLKSNYAALGTWPLAINAYNAGPGRLKQAVRTLGTTSIARIVREFSHPGYQFASRNFFPEFLAALEVFENRQKLFGNIPVAPPLRFDTVVVEKSVVLPHVATQTKVPLETLWELNPGYSAAIYTGRQSLPAGYALKVPQKSGRAFLAAMNQQPDAIAQQ
ncbi:MAG: transglycosylase SLT domain-containing protein [Deltaproteobacteria bacterium]|nr:transglycosylase SLT domain-containing protein [Deltaproteobacteria bacterium]